MQIIFSKYRVRSNNSGWVLQQQCGEQWKKTQYFSSLEGLADTILHKAFHEQTSKTTFYTDDVNNACDVLEALNVRIKAVRDEILGVLRG